MCARWPRGKCIMDRAGQRVPSSVTYGPPLAFLLGTQLGSSLLAKAVPVLARKQKKTLKKQKSSPVPMRSSAVLQAIVNTKCMIVGQFLIKYDEATPVWAKCTGGTAWLVPWWMHSSSRPSPSSGCWRLTQWPGQLYGSGVNSVNTEHLLLHGTTARAVRG